MCFKNLNSKGFTLLEILLVFLVVGIVAALALPTYRDIILKANRSDAIISLLRLSTLLEQFYLSHNKYADDFSELITGVKSGEFYISEGGHYSIMYASTSEGVGWNLVATAIGEQAKDIDCAKLTMSSLGVKSALNKNDDLNSLCWL